MKRLARLIGNSTWQLKLQMCMLGVTAELVIELYMLHADCDPKAEWHGS